MVRAPNEAILTLPGLAFAWAMSSATVLAGMPGFATITSGSSASPATGAMSRWKSNGSDL